ncbi:MAG: biopolymer transporter [Desulfatitalea sp.]|nr:MotA/TolQ/ExbB proton channel family protein [Desulfatitalea sp.]NNK01768.1 biopolymer transporter [Desulfatitalea sp.]
MTTRHLKLAAIFLIIFVSAPVLWAEDMRELQIQRREAREALLEKAKAEKAAAEQAAAQSRAHILADRNALEKAMAELEAANQKLKSQVDGLNDQAERLGQKEVELTEQLAKTDSMINELVGVIRVNAKDLDALIKQNLQTAMADDVRSFLEPIAAESKFPGMADVRAMADAWFGQINASAEVTIRKAEMIDRQGREVEADILLIGPFTAAYRVDGETGFCSYGSAGAQLYALSRLPPGRMQRQITHYMDGESDAVPMDVSRGGALRQLTHELSLWEQIPKGGPIVWPILLILAVGLVIIAERLFFLLRKRFNADALVERIDALALEESWQACQAVCQANPGIPVARVVNAGICCSHLPREEMENALQEAILKEIPPMERFLSTLGMLAAIAPLLGLLGTVTGMIDTFHIITLHGTGDARLMSGGISEALVTTMLGLSVAIPLMLSQTLLNRAVDNRIGEMEEKAVALVNMVHKHKSVKRT